MAKAVKFPKIYFGWWTVLASGILSIWGHGYYTYGISALFKPVASELGFTRAVASVAASVGRFEGAFEAPIVGWIADRFGPKWVVMLGVLIMSLGFILMNFIHSLWAYYVVWGVMAGTGLNLALTLPWEIAISNWFVKKRGTALGVRMVFSGFAGVFALPLIAWLISTQGWRMTCVIGGVVMAALGFPLAWFCLRQHRPEYYGLLPDGAVVKEGSAGQMIDRGVKYAAEVQEVEFTLRQAMHTPSFWLLLIGSAIHSLVAGAMNVHTIPLLTDRGIEPVAAASMMSLMIAASIPGRPVVGFLTDRLGAGKLRYIVGGAYLLEAIGIGLFLLNQSTAMVYAWFVVYGIGYGAGFTLMSIPRARYFGRKALGSIQGSSSMIQSPATIGAPIFAGWVYDSTGSYMPALMVFVALLAIAAVLATFARPPKLPAKLTDVGQIV